MSSSVSLSAERLAALRAETPLVAAGVAHLNHAGASPQPQPVIDAVAEHLALEQSLGGYEAADAAAGRLEDARAALGELVGAAPGSIALVESATAAYAQALSSLDLGPDDTVLLSRHDYASNQIMALSLARHRGVRVLRAADLPEGGVDPDSVAELVRRHRPRLVSVTHMPTGTGVIQDVGAVGRICREEGITYLVDACQTAGQMPLDVEAVGCDFLAATGRKYLRGPRGTGFLFVHPRVLAGDAHPLLLDMRGADWTGADGFTLRPDARRFEWWEGNVAGRIGLGVAARHALDVGLDVIAAVSAGWAGAVRRRAARTERLRPIDVGPRLGAIVSLAVETDLDPYVLQDALRARRVNTSITALTSALLDLGERSGGRSWSLRVSPHVLTDDADLDLLFGALEEILAG